MLQEVGQASALLQHPGPVRGHQLFQVVDPAGQLFPQIGVRHADPVCHFLCDIDLWRILLIPMERFMLRKGQMVGVIY